MYPGHHRCLLSPVAVRVYLNKLTNLKLFNSIGNELTYFLLNMHVCVDYFNVMRSNICYSSELVLIHEYANKVQLSPFSKNHVLCFILMSEYTTLFIILIY